MTGQGLELNTSFGVNCVVWLCGLPKEEHGPTRRMLEDLQGHGRLPVPVHRYDVFSADELLEAIGALCKVAQAGSRPVLHLDMHGSKAKGLKVGSDFIGWEALGQSLRELNIATKNNLVVVGGACHALFAIRSVDIHSATPFFALLAPEEEVQSGFLEDRIVPFYEELFKAGSLDEAFRRLGPPFKYEHCEKLLSIVLARYIKAGLKGKNLEERRERLLTEVFQGRGDSAPEALKQARQVLKGGLRPNQELVDRYAATFLCGRPCSFGIDQLLKLVQ